MYASGSSRVMQASSMLSGPLDEHFGNRYGIASRRRSAALWSTSAPVSMNAGSWSALCISRNKLHLDVPYGPFRCRSIPLAQRFVTCLQRARRRYVLYFTTRPSPCNYASCMLFRAPSSSALIVAN